MKPVARPFAMATGLVLLLMITPSWGQTPVCAAPGCNPTKSSGFPEPSGNTAGGSASLGALSTGHENTAFGYQALVLNTTGSNNTAVGTFALISNNGSDNTAIGKFALRNNTTGNNNTASGADALTSNTT